EWIEVLHRSDSKSAKLLDIHWADWSYATRRVAGTLSGRIPANTGNKIMDIVHPVETIYPGVEMNLEVRSFERRISHPFGQLWCISVRRCTRWRLLVDYPWRIEVGSWKGRHHDASDRRDEYD